MPIVARNVARSPCCRSPGAAAVPLALAASLLVAATGLGAAPLPIHEEAVRAFQAYLAIDTTNPPGREMRAARFLKRILDRERIPCDLFDLGGGRANLCARLPGDGSRGGVILLHHMDVVPADPQYWSHPPFSGRLVEGQIYGRGAVDMKGKGIIDLMTMVLIKRRGLPLKRDLILLAVADEECGSLGARWIVRSRPDLVRGARILVDEGQCIRKGRAGAPDDYLVAVGQKRVLWLTITFAGRPGHGSVPHADSAVNRAVRAAHRIASHDPERVLLPALVPYVKLLLEGTDWRSLAGAADSLDASLSNPRFLRAIARDPKVDACLRDTIAVTRLRGSDKINTIPNEASIGLDCRLMPGTRVGPFLARLRKLVDDPGARVVVEEGADFEPGPMAPVDSDFMAAVAAAAARRNSASRVVPVILLSSTDSALFSRLGIACYGFEPYALTDEEYDRGHGNDERLSAANVRFGIDLLAEIITRLNR